MALTKLPKDGLATNSVSTSQIEDGTIQNTEFTDGTLTSAKLASTLDLSSKTVTLPNTSVTNAQLSGSIANAKLANSTITFNGTSIALGASGVAQVGVEWQSIITSNTTMVAGRGYFVNTSGGAITMTLPSSGTIGDTISIKDYAGTFATNKLTIARNSHKIQGFTENMLLNTNRAQVTLVYVDATKGWLFTDEHNVGDLELNPYVTATGGTVTNTGDFRIHTFNSSSNFVVSDAGAGNPYSGKVSYLVVAGGGSGSNQGGGGGAGGFREGRVSTPDFTASPLVAPGGLTVSAQTYPITVGSGAAGAASPNSYAGSTGSNSVFSTITSAGGGRGGCKSNSSATHHRGGSGGGGAGLYSPVSTPEATRQGGIGNYPPVSPSQGTNGGDGRPAGGGYVKASGGGGGAGAAGSPAPNDDTGGAGGAGVSTEISGSAVTRGGGGGGAANKSDGTGGAAGTGGGSAGSGGNNNSANATANTGGGAGGLGNDPNTGGNGGSGVVIIRYKYQN